MSRLKYWRMGVLGSLVTLAHAESYMATFDQAQWQVQRSPLVCRLTQAVPHFGEAIFEAVGGGRQRFMLRAQKNPLAGGPAKLTAMAPSWNPARAPIALGAIEITDGTEPLQLGGESAAQLLDSLRAGLVPTFARPLLSDTRKTANIALSPVNFRPAYRQYHACIEQLLPVTFEQVKNTIIEFARHQQNLSAEAQKKIDLLLRYIAADPSITHFEIRGISSDSGRMLDNLALAKQRTEQVSEYLMSRGIDAKAIESIYHGEHATKNNQHRFVSIRLERGIVSN